MIYAGDDWQSSSYTGYHASALIFLAQFNFKSTQRAFRKHLEHSESIKVRLG